MSSVSDQSLAQQQPLADTRGAIAALAAHHQRGLAREGAEDDLAIHIFGEMARERGLAGARIAEQAKHLRRAGDAGARLEPGRDRLEGGILMWREDRHDVASA